MLHWLHSLPRVVECERQPLGWVEVGCTRAYRDVALPTTNSQHRESFVRESDLSSIDQTQHSTPDSRQADRQAGRQAEARRAGVHAVAATAGGFLGYNTTGAVM